MKWNKLKEWLKKEDPELKCKPCYIIQNILAEMSELEKESEWLPINDEAKNGERRLLLLTDGFILIAKYSNGGWYPWERYMQVHDISIKAWQPLPKVSSDD